MVALASPHHRLADRQLEQRVAAELFAADPMRFRQVSVHVRRGVVVLAGTVRTYYAKSLGFQQARRITGVSAVIDSLHVDPSARGSSLGGDR